MPINLRIIAIAVFLAVGIHKPEAKQHPMESLGVTLFNTFRSNDFDAFFVRSVFSHNEETFRAFLLSVRNKTLRDNLIALHKMPFPESVKSPTQKWREAFKHNWREQWRHIARKSNREVFNQAFAPSSKGARKGRHSMGNDSTRGKRDSFARDLDQRRFQNQRRQRFGRNHHGLHPRRGSRLNSWNSRRGNELNRRDTDCRSLEEFNGRQGRLAGQRPHSPSRRQGCFKQRSYRRSYLESQPG